VPARRPTKSSLSSEPGRHHAPVPTISRNTLVLDLLVPNLFHGRPWPLGATVPGPAGPAPSGRPRATEVVSRPTLVSRLGRAGRRFAKRRRENTYTDPLFGSWRRVEDDYYRLSNRT